MSAYLTIVTQNTVFLQAYQNGQITLADYQTAIAQQNSQLQSLLVQGYITQAQYNSAVAAELSSSIGGVTSTLTKTYAGVPLYAWILIAAAAAIALIFIVRR